MVKAMLVGAIMACAWAIALFFWRFWKKTGDRLFLFFAPAFLLLGIERIVIMMVTGEARPFVYCIRLVAFLLMLFAIWDKNRSGDRRL